MQYVSTRGQTAAISFSEALLAGLAPDGGLYVPEHYPLLQKAQIADFAGNPFSTVAETVLQPLIGGTIGEGALASMVREAWRGFRHNATCPLVQVEDNLFVLELFHGPTLAFKDVAMQLLARLMDHTLAQSGKRAVIVAATSGDTGSAAVDAFHDLDNIDLFILYPHGRVSEVQRRQMTGIVAPNIHAIALEGTFDDAQGIVKGLFAQAQFREEMSLSGVNSINWARIAAQIVYYFTSAVVLGAPHRPVSFSVPTGNFGDILAGYVAGRMGLPVQRLQIATNANDILARTLATGAYEVRTVAATASPSMDIQVSSNFERLIFEASDGDAALVRSLMASLKQSGRFVLPDTVLGAIRERFSAHAVGEDETLEEITTLYKTCGYLADPHTAIGIRAGRCLLEQEPSIPVIALATAHPAKFPDAMHRACGFCPPLPAHMADLMSRSENLTRLPNDQAVVEAFIRERVHRS
jgi:threonine synthase